MSVCPWCGVCFESYTAPNGRVKVFCQRECKDDFNAQASFIGREILFILHEIDGIPLRGREFTLDPYQGPQDA